MRPREEGVGEVKRWFLGGRGRRRGCGRSGQAEELRWSCVREFRVGGAQRERWDGVFGGGEPSSWVRVCWVGFFDGPGILTQGGWHAGWVRRAVKIVRTRGYGCEPGWEGS